MHKIIFFLLFTFPLWVFAQKKALTHSVYDGWKSAGERKISNNGNYILYAINEQEGDGQLTIRGLQDADSILITNGYNASFTPDSRYVILKIKPHFADTRQAKIKKKKPDEMPKDSLAIIAMGTDSILKISRVQSYKIPEKSSGWLAYQLEKSLPDTAKKAAKPDSIKKQIDVLAKVADSVIRTSLQKVKGKIKKEQVIAAAEKAAKIIQRNAADGMLTDADDDGTPGSKANDGNDLIVRNLATGKEKKYPGVSSYMFDDYGTVLLIETTRNKKDSNSKACLILQHLQTGITDTIFKGFNDAGSFSFDESGAQLAFTAETDSSEKALQKFYKLWYYALADDTARLIADKNTIGMKLGMGISENAKINFSKDGKKLFFGIAALQPAKDTSLVDFELARLDIWNYKDDYLQPQQLKQLRMESSRSYLAVMNLQKTAVIPLGGVDAENCSLVNEGNADWVLAQTSSGNRQSMQWEGRPRWTLYKINTIDGSRTLIKKNNLSAASASPEGKFVYWYDPQQRNYFAYNMESGSIKNISAKITVPLYNTEFDMPDYPNAAGFTGWMQHDSLVLINDEYDIWAVDPNAISAPINITAGTGRKNKWVYDAYQFDRDQRFFNPADTLWLSHFNKINKEAGFSIKVLNTSSAPQSFGSVPYSYPSVLKAKDANVFLVQQSNISASEIYAGNHFNNLKQYTHIADQQKDYNWLTAGLVHWKMFDGKMSEGILYKPENFDPHKKYPIVFYFYEKNADGLYSYKVPAPSASIINIPYFVSNGYLVFDPNIYYKTGEPGASAYNSVVSAAKYLAAFSYVDSSKMGIQGQSWGGYQVAYLITRTNIFKAAGAGAPVANMTSAYGGIRWGSGINRQFQYEKTQSRLGATLWQRQDLYIKNSPLFFVDKIKTPVLIMANDQDGSVPWYQGIEFFTALKRLGKPAWLLQYNGEDHNLVERRNRKDLSIRLSQFFDHYLKGARAPYWMTRGVPATEKNRDWGLEIDEKAGEN